jgi:hypothetical protein
MTLTEFQAALDREFHGEMRIRWSDAREAYLLETRAGRGVWDADVSTQPYRRQDEAIALRDGYRFFMELRLGTATPCRGCGAGLKIPAFEPVQAACPRCRYIQAVAYFPLGDTLLDHLRKLNPKGTYHQNVVRELDRANADRDAALQRDAANVVESTTLDLYNEMVGIPAFGYAGRTAAWTNAPASPLAPEAPAA